VFSVEFPFVFSFDFLSILVLFSVFLILFVIPFGAHSGSWDATLVSPAPPYKVETQNKRKKWKSGRNGFVLSTLQRGAGILLP
jgi:hypothetical protein